MPNEELILDEQKKQQLDSNIKNMLSNGATQEDVMSYASDFKTKYGQKKSLIGNDTSKTLENGVSDTQKVEEFDFASQAGGWSGGNKEQAQPQTKPQELKTPAYGGMKEKSNTGKKFTNSSTGSFEETEEEVYKENYDNNLFGTQQYAKESLINNANKLGIDVSPVLEDTDISSQSDKLYQVQQEVIKKEKELQLQAPLLNSVYGSQTEQNANKEFANKQLETLNQLKKQLGFQQEIVKQKATNNINAFAQSDIDYSDNKNIRQSMLKGGLEYYTATNPEEAKRINKLTENGINPDEQTLYNIETAGFDAQSKSIEKRVKELSGKIPQERMIELTNQLNKEISYINGLGDNYQPKTQQELDDYNNKVREIQNKQSELTDIQLKYDSEIGEVKKLSDEYNKLIEYRNQSINNYPTLKAKLDRQKELDTNYASGGFWDKSYYQVLAPVSAFRDELEKGFTNTLGNTLGFMGLMDSDMVINAQRKQELTVDPKQPSQTTTLLPKNEKGESLGMNYDALLPTMIHTTLQSLGFAKGASVLNAATKLPMGASQFASTFMQIQSQYMDDAINKGLSSDDAFKVASVLSGIESLSELIIPDYKIWGAFGKLEKGALKGIYSNALDLWRMGASGKIPEFIAMASDFTKQALKTAIPEIGEEYVSQIGQIMTENAYNMLNDDSKLDMAVSPFDLQTATDIAIETSIGMLPMTVLGGVGGFSMGNKSTMYHAAINPDLFNNAIQNSFDSGTINQAKFDELKLKTATLEGIGKIMPTKNIKGEELTEEQKAEYISAMYSKAMAKRTKDNLEKQGITNTKANEEVKITEEQAQAVITEIFTGEKVEPKLEEIKLEETKPEAPKQEVIVDENVKPTPNKVKVLGKDVNMYNDYIPSKAEDVEPEAMYVFNSDSKDGIPSMLHDVAYANKREVNGVKTENWHASISGDDLLKLYPKETAKKSTSKQEVISKKEYERIKAIQGINSELLMKGEAEKIKAYEDSLNENLQVNTTNNGKEKGQEEDVLSTQNPIQEDIATEPVSSDVMSETPTELRDVESTAKALEEGDKIQWNVFGNEESGEWNVVGKTKTRGGKDAVILSKVYVEASSDGKSYTKEYADANGIKYDNERTVEHIVPLEDLKSESLLSKEQTPKAENKKADVVGSGVVNMWKLTQEESFKANEDTDSGEGVRTHEEMATEFLSGYKNGKEGLSVEGNSVVFRNKEGKPIGFAHFDKDGVREIGVDKSERGNGIASKMIDYLKQEKGIDKVLPPFSKEGNILSHRNEVKKAIAEGKYQKAIAEGRMTANDAKAIIESAGLEVPKDIESLLSKEQTPKAENKKADVVGSGVVETKQQIENFGVKKEDVEPVHSVISKVFDGLKKAGLTAAKTVGEWVGIGKGEEKSYSLKINGKEVQVKNVQPEVVNGFYSPLEKTINETKADKLPAKQWIEKYANSEEAKWTGLKDWLAQQQGSVSKADIQQYLKDNRISVVEVVKGAFNKEEILTKKEWIKNRQKELQEQDGEDAENLSYYKDIAEGQWEEEANTYNDAPKVEDTSKFSQYQLEGEKENYKEVLVTMPTQRQNAKVIEKEGKWKIQHSDGSLSPVSFATKPFAEKALKEYIDREQSGERVDKGTFKSSHFDEPNILVHLRMNTRTDADGKKVLFLEEVQSDWGQKGKKEGFETPEKKAELKKLQDNASAATQKFNEIEEELNKQYSEKKKEGESRSDLRKRDSDFNKLAQEYAPAAQKMFDSRRAFDMFQVDNRGEVPTAPFVSDTNSWTKLGLKVALKEAVKQGADKIAWSTGTQQFDRWGSEKISWKKEGNKWKLDVKEQQGGDAFGAMNIDEKALSETNVSVDSKERLRQVIKANLSRERNDAEIDKLTDRIWNRMQTEDSGTSLPRKEGMEEFYGNPKDMERAKNFTIKKEGELFAVKDEKGKTIRTFKQENEANKFKENYGLGIVGNVAKSLFKQEVGTVEIKLSDSSPSNEVYFNDWQAVGYIGKFPQWRAELDDITYEIGTSDGIKYTLWRGEEKVGVFNSVKQAQDAASGTETGRTSTQHSIDITPELKASAEGGQPLFKTEESKKDFGGFETRDGKPIGFTYDTDKVARERFDISKLKKIGSGSDRDVYDLGNGKVLKVAKTARGLTQNIYEGDFYLKGIIPEVFERGLNYVVAENTPNIKVTDIVPTYDSDGNLIEGNKYKASEMLDELSKFNQKDFDKADSKLQDVLTKYGLQDIMSYNVLWNDFKAKRNWGYKDGIAYHSDGGTFGGVAMIDSYTGKTNQSDPEFRKIYEESKKLKKQFGDTDKATMYSKDGGEIQAQYRIESGKNIVEAIKDFNGSPRATVALTHEIMHPTVVAIIDGAKEGNKVGLKHTETIVNEFNKANPKNKITVEELINGNDAFKNGTTSKEYRAVQEFIAKAWEKYHTEGGKGFSEAFQKVLEQITQAFRSVYQSIKGKDVTPELRKMFDEILGKEYTQEVKVEQNKKENKKQKNIKDEKQTNKGTGKSSNSENSNSNKNDKEKTITKRVGTPKSKRIPRNKEYIKALSVTPSTPYDFVMQYFIGNGTITKRMLEKLYGTTGDIKKTNRRVNPEMKARFGMMNYKGNDSIETLAEGLYSDMPEHLQDIYEMSDFVSEIESAIQLYVGRSKMVKDFNKVHFAEEQFNEENIDDFYVEAESIFDTLTDEEKEMLLAPTTSQEFINAMVEGILEEESNPLSKENKIADAANKLADDFAKKFKSSPPPKFYDKDGNEMQIFTKGATWNDMVKAIEEGIRQVGDIAQAISNYLESQKWFQDLTDANKKIITERVKSKFLEEKSKEIKPPVEPTTDNDFKTVEDIEGQDLSGIRKALVSDEVIEGVDLERVSDKQMMAMGRKILDSGEINPDALVTKIITDGRGVLTPTEVVALITYKRDIDNALTDTYTKIADAKKNGEDIGTLGVEAKNLERQIEDFDVMAVITAQQQSMAFRLRQRMLDRDYNVVTQIQKYKANNDGEIPADVEAKFRELDKQLKEVKAKLVEVEKRLDEKEGQEAVNNIKESVGREKKSEDDIDNKVRVGVQKEIDDIYKQLPSNKKSLADKAIKALENFQNKLRAKNYSDATGAVAIIDAGITTIKSAIKAGVSVSKAIELGIAKIKEKLKLKGIDRWDKEEEFRKDMIDGFEGEGISTKKPSNDSPTINDDGTVSIPNEMLRDLVRRGITDIEGLTKAVHEQVKKDLPDVTERQVRDYITDYGKKVNPTADEIQTQINTAKRVGKLLSELEDLKTMSKVEFIKKYQKLKPSEAKISDREREIKRQINALGKDIATLDNTKTDAERLKSAKESVRRRIEELTKKIQNKDFSKPTKKLPVTDAELVTLIAEKEKLQEEFDNEQYKLKLKNRGFWQIWEDRAYEATSGLMRGLTLGVDLSAMGVQGMRRLFTNPKLSSIAFLEGLKHLVSEKGANEFLAKQKAQPYYPLLMATKLAIDDKSGKQSVKEGMFVSDWINLIWNKAIAPIAGLGTKWGTEFVRKVNPYLASQRAYDGYVNSIRIQSFLKLANQLVDDGYTYESDPKVFDKLADFVNTTTGRGSLGQADTNSKWLNVFLTAPRKVISEVKLYTLYAFAYYARMPKAVRMKALRDFAQFTATFMLVNGLLWAARKDWDDDDEDEDNFWNMNSSDFLTHKFGDKRVSIGGGMKSILTMQSRFITGNFTDQYGITSKLGDRYGKPINTRFDLLIRFGSAKAAPIFNVLAKKLDERAGREVESEELVKNISVPLWLQDIGELYENDPNSIAPLLTALSILGANARTVKKEVPSEIKNDNGEVVTLDDAQKNKLQLEFDEKNSEYIKALVKTEAYKNLKDDIAKSKLKEMATDAAMKESINNLKKQNRDIFPKKSLKSKIKQYNEELETWKLKKRIGIKVGDKPNRPTN